MNEVFLIGKIVTDINFDFIINSKHCGLATFKIETLNRQVIQINAYDKIADDVYRKLKIEDSIFIHGRLGKNRVTATKIKIL